jgi:hypothetical protein
VANNADEESMTLKHLAKALIALLLTVALAGCGSRFDDLQMLKGKTKQEVLDALGEPTGKTTANFRPVGYGPHRSLQGVLPVGHPYETWTWEHNGDAHSVFFADPANPDSDPKGWTVTMTATLEEGSVY